MDTTPQPRRAGLAITVCVLANMIDGFDVLATAYTSTAIRREWNLDSGQLGAVLSAGLAGMVLGSLFIAPLADRFGRRPVTIACMAVMSLAMLLSWQATDVLQLILLRIVTGLGAGGILAALNTTVAEVASPARRNLALSILTTGFAAGSIAGGLVSVFLMERFGWRVVFLLGGLLTAAVLLLAIRYLPETARHEKIDQEPSGYAALFGPSLRWETLLISGAFFLHMVSFYFILNWTPRLVEMMGLAPQVGVTSAVIINAGALVGAFVYGFPADWVRGRSIGQYFFWSYACFIALFAVLPAEDAPLYAIAAVLGIIMTAAMTSLYTLAPRVFPQHVRAGGTGFAIGAGRLGAAIGSFAAGQLMNLGVERWGLYVVFAAPPVIAGFLVAMAFNRDAARLRKLLHALIHRINTTHSGKTTDDA